ncbi:hey-like transcription factor [Saccoglossus kowalevskii]|uniref:Hairy and enhancer of split-related protein HELT n=1 Tax=Saccoglossus kowalevskii TaxID=10224 RepID=D1LX41_SACKO|nr:hey-like transcription factor [Saccoglossus kowalevskii]ACY92547.1 hey-like transcription factor [Saccoglossus kowalevskii]
MSSRKRERGEQTSHKVIEKRRRDRINNCLSELSQTVPAAFAKQTSGKLEKAEILEMTVEYLRAIQRSGLAAKFENAGYNPETTWQDSWQELSEYYQTGYNDCMKEIARYLTDIEGIDLNDSRCVRIMSYLQQRFRSEHRPMPGNGITAPSSASTGSLRLEGGSFPLPHTSISPSVKQEQSAAQRASHHHHHHHHHLPSFHRCNAHPHHHLCSFTASSTSSNPDQKTSSPIFTACGGVNIAPQSCNVAMPTPIKPTSSLYAHPSHIPSAINKPNSGLSAFAFNHHTTRIKPLTSHLPTLMTSHMNSSTPLAATSTSAILTHSLVVP